MPKYTNSFRSPTFIQETIIDEVGKIIGTIRIKPVSVAWKPAGQSKYFSVKIEDFGNWITDSKTNATRTTS